MAGPGAGDAKAKRGEATGSLRRALALDLLLKRVQDVLASAKGSTPGTVTALLTDRGVVVARQPVLFLMSSVADTPGYPELVSRTGAGEAVFGPGIAPA
jgi:hypothetical protein